MFSCFNGNAGSTSVVPSTSLCTLIRNEAPDKDILDHIKNYPGTINDADRHKKTALMAAIEDERMVIIKALLAAKADLELEDIEGWRALHYACNTGKPDIVQIVLDSGPEVNAIAGKAGLTPLHLAVGDSLAEIVCIMREANADNKIKDAFGRTPAEYWKLVKKEGETSVSCASMKIMQENRQTEAILEVPEVHVAEGAHSNSATIKKYNYDAK